MMPVFYFAFIDIIDQLVPKNHTADTSVLGSDLVTYTGDFHIECTKYYATSFDVGWEQEGSQVLLMGSFLHDVQSVIESAIR